MYQIFPRMNGIFLIKIGPSEKCFFLLDHLAYIITKFIDLSTFLHKEFFHQLEYFLFCLLTAIVN